MDERPDTAKEFYGVIIVSMILGMGFALSKINAIKLLLISAVANGLLAPPLILLLLIVCNNRRIMGEHRNGIWLNMLGGLTTTLMTAASIALLVSFIV
jgi:Mn2+/Fe2+ NRAMP family transporter